jgi:hypothetical protein
VTPQASLASPLAQRRAELEIQLEAIAGSIVPLTAQDEERLAKLRPIVRAGAAILQERLATMPTAAATQWEILTEVGQQTQRLAEESLALVGGVAARRLRLDGGTCDLADALLRSLAGQLLVGYQPVTIPASSEYINVLSEVIRVRFPGSGIWDLPVVLHEFGHFLLPRAGLQADSPVKAIVARERGTRRNLGSFAEEIWADTFAAYVGGPAYAFSLVARLNPSKAHEDAKPSHPAPMKRAVAVFSTLDALQAAWVRKGVPAGNLTPYLAGARALWSDRLRSAEQLVAPSDDHRLYASKLASEFLAVLDGEWVGCRYANAQRATALSKSIESGQAGVRGVSIIDVLNAAWLARRTAEVDGRSDKVAGITRVVTEMCANIAVSGWLQP